MGAVARHRIDDAGDSTASFAQLRPRSRWVRIGGNPAALSAAGLVIAIGLVLASWSALQEKADSSGQPPGASPTSPVDITVSVIPSPSESGSAPTTGPTPGPSSPQSPSTAGSPWRAPSPTGEPTSTAAPTVAPTGAPAAAPTGASGFTVTYRLVSQSDKGFRGEFTVTNVSTAAARWIVTASFGKRISFSQPTNAILCPAGHDFVAVAEQPLAVGQSVTVSFDATYLLRKTPSTPAPSAAAITPQWPGCPPEEDD